MTSRSPAVEILVHVTAPARVADDATYRQIARAYLAFRPDAATRISFEAPSQQRRRQAHQTLSSSGQNFATPDAPPAVVSPACFGSPPPPPPVQESQDLSFQSALDNRSSPRLIQQQNRLRAHAASAAPRPSSSSQPLWTAPPSQISDSFPIPDSSFVRGTPTGILEHYLSRAAAASSSSAAPSFPLTSPASSSSPPPPPYPVSQTGPPLSSRPSGNDIHVPSSVPVPSSAPESDGDGNNDNNGSSSSSSEHFVSAQQRLQQEEDKQGCSEKVIPVTPAPNVNKRKNTTALAAVPARDTSDHHHHQDEPAFDITHISDSFVSSSAPPASSSPPPTTGSPNEAGEQQQRPNKLAKVAERGAQTRRHPGRASPTLSPSEAAIAHSLDIRPPSPAVSVSHLDPSSLVSPQLDKLARDLSSRYKPSHHRALDPFERGFWLVDCTSWSAAARLDTWVFLTNYLKSGLAGWGVWCRRDESHSHIRLYCWGHVVKHTYLLLYLASDRRIRTTGTTWRDAGGKVVLETLGSGKENPT